MSNRHQVISRAILFLPLFLITAQRPLTEKNPVWDDSFYRMFDINQFQLYPPANEQFDFEQINTPLLDAAIFYETNRVRLSFGKKSLKHSTALEQSALNHARDMVTWNFTSHFNLNDKKHKTPQDRMSEVGVGSGVRGENIADTFGIRYHSGDPVITPKAGSPNFVDFYTGEPIPNHTYLSFAADLVNQWMHSPPHRETMLDGRFKFLGCGACLYKRRNFYNMDCFKVVQNFASEVPR